MDEKKELYRELVREIFTRQDFLEDLAYVLTQTPEAMTILTKAVQKNLKAPKEKKTRIYSPLIKVSEIAECYGKVGAWLNELLFECGIQEKIDGTWYIMPKFENMGYTEIRPIKVINDGVEEIKQFTFWTVEGAYAIQCLLHREGFNPDPEKWYNLIHRAKGGIV